MGRYRYGLCGWQRKFKVHLVENGKPVCGLHLSAGWPGFATVQDDMIERRRLCTNCRNIKIQRRRKCWPEKEIPVTTLRSDFSDRNVYDMIIPPWSEHQRVLGQWRPKDRG